MKTFAMRDTFPARLARDESYAIKGMTLSVSTGYLLLPRSLAFFLVLTRCTLLYGLYVEGGYAYNGEYMDEAHDVEWITSAFVLRCPVPARMQELMLAVGLPKDIELEEAMGPGAHQIAQPGTSWGQHRDVIEKYIYASLQIKAQLLEARSRTFLRDS
ncbi:hypothetical protein VTL71DRAFT_3535 [Oculimacula yallundae]|uniref:Uncharacterized protein n=1 Tax=Oculimacula yallundae TaxID=86028 RepID=A0ABR4C7F4_9HELO